MKTELTQRPYFYYQYTKNLDLKLLADVLGDEFQEILDFVNGFNPADYSAHEGAMLDFLAAGLYDFYRPVIATGAAIAGLGALGSAAQGSLAWGGGIPGVPVTNYKTLTDDEFKRVLQWHLYFADGKTFTILWLKRRIKRFISPWFSIIDDTSDISITLPDRQNFPSRGTFSGFAAWGGLAMGGMIPINTPVIGEESTWTITINITPENAELAETFYWLVKSNKLALPEINKYEVILNG